MPDKYLVTNKLISFSLIPEVVKEFSMKKKCFEIGTVLPSFHPNKSIPLSRSKLLHHDLGGLSGCWTPPPLSPTFPLSSHLCPGLSP